MANAFTLFGEIQVDTSKLQSGLDRVEAKLRATESAMAETESAGKALGVNTATQARSFEKLSQTLGTAQGKLDAAVDAYTAGAISTKQFATVLSQVDRAVSGANSKVADTAAKFNDYASAADKAKAANERFAASAKSAQENADKVGSKLESAGGAMESIGGRLTAAVTLPIAAAGAGILAAGVEYEAGMNYFGAVTNATADQMAKAAQVAQQLGADTMLPATSAKDAALAMVELGKAGMTADQAMEAARGTMLLAAAGQLSAAQASEITANALNTFGLAAGEATRVSDLLAAAANASSADVTDVAQSMQQAGAVFAASGVPVEDLTTAIGLMANAGIKGSDAGTSLKTFLTRLKAPTDAAAASLKQLGVDVYDSAGNMKDLPQILGEFESGLQGLTEKDKAEALTNIFGSDAIRAAEILFKSGKAGFDQMKTSVTEVGAAATLAGAMTAGVGGRWDALTSQLETIGIKMYEAIKVPLNQLLTFATSVLEGLGAIFDSLSPAGQAAVIAFAALAAILPPIIVVVGMIVSAIGAALPVITAIGGAITLAGGGIAGAAAAAGTALSAFGATVSAALAPILPVIGAVVLAIGAAVAIAYVLYKAYETNFGGLKDAVDSAIGAVVETFDSAKATLLAFWDENGGKIKEAGANIAAFASKVFEYIEPVARFFVDVLGAQLKMVWGIVKAVFAGIWGVISGVFMTIVNLIRGDWAGAWESFKGIFTSVWDMIKGIFGAIFEYLSTIFTKIGTLILDGVTWIADKAKAIGTAIIDGIVNAVSSGASLIWDAIKSLGMSAISAFKSVLGIASPSKVFYGIGKDTVQGFIDGVAALKVTANAGLAALIDPKQIGGALKGKFGEALLGFITPLVGELAKLENATKQQEFDQWLTKFGKLTPEMQKAVAAIRPFIVEFDKLQAAGKEKEFLNTVAGLDIELKKLNATTEQEKLLIDLTTEAYAKYTPAQLEVIKNKKLEILATQEAIKKAEDKKKLDEDTQKTIADLVKIEGAKKTVLEQVNEQIAKAIAGGVTYTDQQLAQFRASAAAADAMALQKQAVSDLAAFMQDLGLKTEVTKTNSEKLVAVLSNMDALKEMADRLGISIDELKAKLTAAATEADTPTFFGTLAAGIDKLKENLGSFSELAANVTLDFVNGFGNVFQQAVQNWDGTLSGFFKNVANGFKKLVLDIIAQLVRFAAMQAIIKIFTALGLGGLGGSTPTGVGQNFGMDGIASGAGATFAAAGGLIKGRGTGTSDSIPAMLSNGEYVMPAASVKKYGASFFESLRSMAAPSPTLAYAGAGGVSNTNATTFNNSFNINVGGGAGGDNKQTAAMIQNEILKGLQKQQRRNR